MTGCHQASSSPSGPACCGHCCICCRHDRCGVCQQRRLRQRDALASPAGTQVCANSFWLRLDAPLDPALESFLRMQAHSFATEVPHLPRNRGEGDTSENYKNRSRRIGNTGQWTPMRPRMCSATYVATALCHIIVDLVDGLA